MHGESTSANVESANDFVNSTVQDLIKNYTNENIFNADETGLLYKALPNKTLNKGRCEVAGMKNSKERLTLLLVCNASGTFKYMCAIGKHKNSRCFKTVKDIPVKCFANSTAWMTTEIWNSIIDLDHQMKRENRKIILFADNASCHKVNVNLENINIQFLPANTTAILQPLDQGIIKSFKSHYRNIIVRKQVLAVESDQTLKEFSKSISVLNALYYCKRSWWLIKKETIENCFKKAKIYAKNEESRDEIVIVTESDIFSDLPISNAEFKDYVDCDEDLKCFSLATDDDIVNDIIQKRDDDIRVEYDYNSNEAEEENQDDNICIPELKDVLNALSTIRLFARSKAIDVEELEYVEERIYKEQQKHLKQKRITEYFS